MNATKPIIAVVDDEESVRVALSRLLRSTHFSVETFPSGAEFLESLKSHRPDCVILDMRMPGVNGFMVLARLKNAGIRLPIVVISGHDDDHGREQALANGAWAYLEKPVNDETLLGAMAGAMAHTLEAIAPTGEKPGHVDAAPTAPIPKPPATTSDFILLSFACGLAVSRALLFLQGAARPGSLFS